MLSPFAGIGSWVGLSITETSITMDIAAMVEYIMGTNVCLCKPFMGISNVDMLHAMSHM